MRRILPVRLFAIASIAALQASCGDVGFEEYEALHATDVSYEEARQDTIVGGYRSAPGSRPYQISLQYNGRHTCGGALVNSEWALTAAHCVYGASASSYRVRAGIDLLSSAAGQTLSVSRIVVHPSYRGAGTYGNHPYDVALLKLASPASSAYTPLALPTAAVMSAVAAPGQSLIVSGWGALSEGGGSPDALYEVAVPVVANATCNQPVAYNGIILDSMICAGYAAGGKDSCQGDSGGPLVATYQGTTYSIGIVSWGEGCARPNKYGVYTRTVSYADWIRSQIGGTTPPAPATALTNGVARTGVAGAQGTWTRFYLDVPAGAANLTIQTSGGTGDADLYTRFGTEPTTASYDCRPYSSGNTESCSVPAPRQGRYYVYLHAYAAFSGVTVRASYSGAP